MNRFISTRTLLTLVVPIVFLFVASEGYGQMGMHGRGMMGGSMIRHHFAMMNGIGSYAPMVNPLPSTAETGAQGKTLYEQNCARCHGPTGLGDGEEGKGLIPPPANIAAATKMPIATDGYLFWTISEGGTPLGTGMPSFKNTLSEEDIWKVIVYLRQL